MTCAAIQWQKLTMVFFFIFREEDLKLKRASLVIGAVASVIFLLCVAMVAITLHLTPELNKLATSKSGHQILHKYPLGPVP